MSSADLPPIDALQRAANLAARRLAAGDDPATIVARFPRQFGVLDPADQARALQLGEEASAALTEIITAGPDMPISELTGQVVPLASGYGVLSFRFAATGRDRRGRDFVTSRLRNVAIGPGDTLETLRQQALDELLVSPEGEDLVYSEDFDELIYLPFDLYD